MARHVILGKGPIGHTLARHLATHGHEVLVLSRSGGRPRLPDAGNRAPGAAGSWADAVTWGAADAADGAALTAAARGADVLHNCVNPPYHRWATDWPPVLGALLAAAEATGAVLVSAGNLYAYGPGPGVMNEVTPMLATDTKGRVRAQMWREMQRRHDAGLVRATEVRGSDYLGPGAGAQAHAGTRLLRPLLAGRPVRSIGSVDVPRTWTYLPDFAAALAAAAATPAAWGRGWHVPSPEPLTLRELAGRFAAAAGAPEPRHAPLPMGMLRAIAVVSPTLRELAEVAYQFTAPFVMDSAASSAALDVRPTPWERIIDETLAAATAGTDARVGRSG